jgi:peptide-methionine (S)-S-oxide reductase
MLTLGFGGGCHWCTEAVFQALAGGLDVRQGFIRSDVPDNGWSEAVEVDFDAGRLSIRDLLSVHLSTHASTSHHKMRGKYRSAVYAADPELLGNCAQDLERLAAETGLPFVTRALAHRGFKPSDPRFHDYYQSAPERPFCQTYIEPKLATLRDRHKRLLRQEHLPS